MGLLQPQTPMAKRFAAPMEMELITTTPMEPEIIRAEQVITLTTQLADTVLVSVAVSLPYITADSILHSHTLLLMVDRLTFNFDKLVVVKPQPAFSFDGLTLFKTFSAVFLRAWVSPKAFSNCF